MPGNSRRRGATRSKSKKGPTVGSGGQRRKGLEGRGPTPKAEDRVKHQAHRAAKSAAKREAARPRRVASLHRGRSQHEVIAGRNAVVEALRTHVPATTLYVASRIDYDDRVREVLKIAAERAVPTLETPRGELDRLTDGAVHQGLALQVPPYTYLDPADLHDPQTPGIPLVVALDGITDPRNLGAILRSVAAFGGQGVVVPERRSVGMTAAAWKTSAGTAARVPVAQATNLVRALEDFRRAGFFIVGLDMEADIDLPDLELATEPLVIVVGSEGKGLSRLVRETCDQIVSIPMADAVESLNAGVAAGVALYEVSRRRRARP
ncbi:23S rRNA (guanosine2251-2'-O)-methyltransferase [Kineosphaera limosa]|uniref:Putative rRNA methyltransferase n=1 Tax=Kineosphaera limosa NBRC 100340 TaxID=1184609 RepID=K6WUS5_9MICO|nr:23S rRNA (guanosine(2251)-2'-O)-methyltransferase RlmB [Kineosphaera limosa]NYD99727.1 23S rRNA (guanosine2251-2'-O)-methyltransferase [Kineosphaera limosa]GAB95827.1 putative rRNA methyltransferase [Kineosphaera limosa NBRC 100340]